MKLIKGSADWADEFDCEFFAVVTDEELQSLLDCAKSRLEEGTIEVYIGTNEWFEIEDFDDWRSNLTFKDISDEEAKIIINYLGNCFGTGSGYISSFMEEDD